MSHPATRSRDFTAEEIDRALLELAACGGNSVAARKRLAERGVKVSDRTLRYWRSDLYPERYYELAERHAQQIESVILADSRETALMAAQVERQALEATSKQLRDGNSKDPAGTARNAATVKGINLDKVLQFTGRPTQITEHRNPDEIIRSLVAKGVLVAEPNGQPHNTARQLPRGDSEPPDSQEDFTDAAA